MNNRYFKMDGSLVFGNLRIMDTENDTVHKFETRIDFDNWLRQNNLETSDIDWK